MYNVNCWEGDTARFHTRSVDWFSRLGKKLNISLFFQAPRRSNCALCAILSFDAIAALRLHALSLVALTIWIARLAVASVNARLMALCRPIEKV